MIDKCFCRGFLCFWILTWTIAFAASVNQPMPMHDGHEVYGWGTFFSIFAFMITTAWFGFMAAVEWKEEK
jgi:hypothetical protein